MNYEDDNNSHTLEDLIKEVGLYSRLISKRNTTHDNLVDMSIKNITLWKVDRNKRIFEIVLYIISFGIIFILEFFFPKITFKLRCKPAYIEDAEYVQIINKRGQSKLIKLRIESFINKEIELQTLNVKNSNKEDDDDEEYNNDLSYQRINKKSRTSTSNFKSNTSTEIGIFNNIDYRRKRPLTENEKITADINKYLIQKKHLNSEKFFEYLNNRYQYEENEGLFVPITFFINRYTMNEILKMKTGIPTMELVNKLSQIYGPNKIKIKHQGIMQSIIKEASDFAYLYVLICMIIWIIMKLYFSSLVVAITSVILIIISSKNKLDNIQSLSGEENKSSFVIREGVEIEIKSESIVPGDIIVLRPGEDGQIYIPCDGIILEGFCTVNESDLTGENTLVLKKEIILPKNKNEYFDYLKHKNSFLFQGTKIDSLYSSQNKEELIKMLATDTGFNTYRGNMLKNWEEQNIQFSRKIYDMMLIVILIAAIVIINIIIYIVIYIKELPKEEFDYYDLLKEKIYNNNFTYDDLPSISSGKKFLEILNNITIIFPPTIILCINYGRIFYNARLKERNISCVIEKKIDSTGHIDIIVLDKTGTLTESQLEMNCYKLSCPDANNNLMIGNEELTSKIMNKIYKKFWQNIYKKKLKCEVNNERMDNSYQTSYLYNIVYFTECLATCHNIFCFNQKIFGNSIDKKLFQEMNWEVFQENDDLKNPIFIQPHNAYKITENSIFNYRWPSINNSVSVSNLNISEAGNDMMLNNSRVTEKENFNRKQSRNNTSKTQKNSDGNISSNNNSGIKGIIKINKKSSNNINNGIRGIIRIKTKKDEDDINSVNNINNINNEMENYHSSSKSKSKIKKRETNFDDSTIKNNNYNYSPAYSSKIKTRKQLKIESNFYLKYLQRSEFQSRFQSMSVIVKNSIDDTIRLYVKGAPEKIKKDCDPETLPHDLDKQLQSFTGKGFRVLACATKVLSTFDPEVDTREKIENEMTFLGLIVFQNQVKKDTKINIKHLETSGCKLIIATGDNVFTTISIAEQCEILHTNDDLFRIETVDNNETNLIITHSSFRGSMRQNKENKNINDDNINNNDFNLDFDEDETEIIYSIKEEENPLEFKEIIKMIVKDINKKICCSGPALSIILDRINTQSNKDNSPEVEEYINNLDKLIRFNGKIFFRMLPDNKSNLIAFLQKDQYTVVAMCGDGANDSNAFMQSDVGVAINQTVGNNLISHFYSTESSINCLQVILKNGRACYESRINTLKYIMTASLIHLSVVFILYYYYQQFNRTQYMFIDIILILFPCLLMTSTKTNYSLSNKKPPKKIVNLNFLLTVFGLYFLQFGGILIFILLGRKFCLDQILDLLPMDDLTTKSSYVFLFLSMQNNFLLLIINSWEINRLPFYTNKLYLLYFSIILIFLIRTITVINSLSFGLPIYRFESDKNEFKRNKETNKILILVINVFVQILSFFYNRFINKFFDWSEEGILIK